MLRKPKIEKNGCLFSFVIDVVTVLWFIPAILTLNDTIFNLHLLCKINDAEQKELNILSADEKTSGSPKGGQYIVYVLGGNIAGIDEKVKTVFTSKDLSYRKIQQIIEAKKLDVWYLPYKKRNFTVPILVYPQKENLFNHILISLTLMFFIPMALLIRLLYYNGRSIWDGITEPFKN